MLRPQWTSSKSATIETGKKKEKKGKNCLNTSKTGNGENVTYISVLFTLWGAKLKQPCAQMSQVESELEPHILYERKG